MGVAEKYSMPKTVETFYKYMFATDSPVSEGEYLDFYRKLIGKQIEILPGTDFQDNNVFVEPGLYDRVFKVLQPRIVTFNGIYYRTIHEWYYSMLAFKVGITCEPIGISVYKLKGSNVIHVIGCWEKVQPLSTTSGWTYTGQISPQDISGIFPSIETEMMKYDFIHGDCHYGNFALKEGRFIAIDWGAAREREERKDSDEGDYTWIDDKGNQRDYDPAKVKELQSKTQGYHFEGLVVAERSKDPYFVFN